ncbi:MAG: hypothetical protein ABSF74_02230 [Dehalococcoidia bacterium]
MKRFVFLSLALLLVLVAGCSESQPTPTVPPVIISFRASPSSINPGGTTTLLWNVTGATSVSIDPGIGQVDVAGTMDLQPTQSTTYTLNAINAAGVMTKTAAVSIAAPNPPVIVNFSATPVAVIPGQTSTLQWNVTGATGVSIDQGIGKVDVAGTRTVTISTSTTYTLSASNAAGSVSKTVAVTVGQAGPPTITSFTADPTQIVAGETATLQWDIKGATSISISPTVGPVSAAGTRVVHPVATTTYTLTATNSNGSVNAPATITIPSAATAKPVVTFTASPSNIATEGSATLQWNVTGSTSVSIDMGIGTVNASGTLAKSPVTTTTYTLTASNANGSTTASATITVGAMTGTLPVITSFTATPSTIVAGGSSLLQWNIRGNLTSVSIDPEVGVPSNFQQTAEVTPTENTTYTLTATSDNGTVTRSVTVTVQ